MRCPRRIPRATLQALAFGRALRGKEIPKGMPMDLNLYGSVDIGHRECLGAADSVTVFDDNQDDRRRRIEGCLDESSSACDTQDPFESSQRTLASVFKRTRRIFAVYSKTGNKVLSRERSKQVGGMVRCMEGEE